MHASDEPMGEMCRACGRQLVERAATSRAGLVRFCEYASCALFGIPSLRHAPQSVTIDDTGEVVGRSS